MRSYSFNLPKSNGHNSGCSCFDCLERVKNFNFEQAFDWAKNNPQDYDFIKNRVDQIIENFKGRRRVRDGFQAGFQENINEYAGGRREYDKLLKEKGLVEIGKDYIPKESNPGINPCANEEFALSAKELGFIDSDREVEAIKSGEYFKNE